jgi:hypothetical protein
MGFMYESVDLAAFFKESATGKKSPDTIPCREWNWPDEAKYKCVNIISFGRTGSRIEMMLAGHTWHSWPGSLSLFPLSSLIARPP